MAILCGHACRRAPPGVRFLLLHGAVGFGLSALLRPALAWADPGGVWQDVLRRTPGHPGPALLLWLFRGLTLGAVQIGAAVMLQDRPEEPPRRLNR